VERPLAIVTGASRGLGAALVRQAPADARVLAISRRRGLDTVRGGVEHVTADLGGEPGWRTVAELFAREIPPHAGRPIVFFHNAGVLTPIGFAGEVDPDAYAHNAVLNGVAPQILGDAFLRAATGCRAQATMVMISSGAGRRPYEGWSSYCAGKAAVDQWVRTVGLEQERRGGRVRVLAVAPGVVATAMQEEIRATPARDFPQLAHFIELHEEGELRSADEVARELWSLPEKALPNGAVLDLRDVKAS
jgi:benzil reductase ((S)-benzoin forming)